MQKTIDSYHKHESLISGLILLLLSLLCSNIQWSNWWNLLLNLKFKELFQNNSVSLISLCILILLIGLSLFLKTKETTEQKDAKAQLQDKDNQIEDLKRKLDDAEQAISDIQSKHIDDLIWINSQFLRFLFKKLQLEMEHRVSLYIHHDDKNYFSIIGRHSDNTNLCKFNRRTFSDQEGVIGCAWHGKTIKISNKNQKIEFNKVIYMPTKHPSYLNTCKQLGIDEVTAKKLRMKSQTLLPIMVEANERKIGIILLESNKNKDPLLNKDTEAIINSVKECKLFIIDIVNRYISLQNQSNSMLTEKGDSNDVQTS